MYPRRCSTKRGEISRLCTTICKSVRSAWVSGNAHFGLTQPPTTRFASKWAEFRVRCGNDARWDVWPHLGRRFVARPTELGNPHQTRVPTFPQRPRRRAADSDKAQPQ
jgi:hypothetical protein